MRIPTAPETLTLEIRRLWNGDACPVPALEAVAEVWREQNGDLGFRARMPILPGERVPDAPVGTHVDKLWEYDVVELFLAENEEKYVEIELGAGGHFLVFSFAGPRKRASDHLDLKPEVTHERSETHWTTEIRLPASVVPEPVWALNAFACAQDQYLAYAPMPGAKPDFHQPSAFVPCEE